MALPTSLEQQTLDYDYWGQPFGGGAAKLGLNLETLDYDYWGEPHCNNDALLPRRRVSIAS